VRALYLYSAAADVAAETGDARLLATCRRMWQSITRRRMFVTGGVGSSAHGEAFTRDYDLPNETAYAESCANIALVFFAHRMLQIDADAQYADVMERALYNGVLSGIALDGRKFFYVNRLASFPTPGNSSSARQSWFGCACCPPNIARMIASLGQYVYSTSADGLYVHLYVDGRAEAEIGGQTVKITQRTAYPWQGRIALTVAPAAPARFTVALRIPAWCRQAALKVNGRTLRLPRLMAQGYAHITRRWTAGDTIDLTLAMPVERIEAHPAAREDCGKVALQRGPVVYCLEEIDNGQDLADIRLPRRARLQVKFDKRLGGAAVITGQALRREAKGWSDALYRPAVSKLRTAPIKAVPYCLWNNRGDGEMLVWMQETP
jgi:uncharacterized protein